MRYWEKSKIVKQVEWKFCTGSFSLEKNVYQVEFGSLNYKRKERRIFVNSFISKIKE